MRRNCKSILLVSIRRWALTTLLICVIQHQLRGDEPYEKLPNLLKIGDNSEKVVSTVGPLFAFEPFGGENPTDVNSISDKTLYGFEKTLGGLDFSGGVLFNEGSIVLWGVGLVANGFDRSALSQILGSFYKQLGSPDNFDAATCTSFKEPVNVPVATWKRGDITYAIAWLLATDKPGWVEFKAIKDGAVDKEFPLFPLQKITDDERMSIIKQGLTEFRTITTDQK